MTRRALVVDDDRFMVKTLAEILKLQGWEVATAYSGTEAVDVASRGSFDAVVMDVKMPGMDGVAAFKAMKAANPNIRVVLMTAYAADELIADAERSGVARVMTKPVNIPALLSMLAASHDRKRPILLIDNDVAFIKTLSEILQLEGYETVIAESLEEAMRLMQQRSPAAVLLHMHIGTASARETLVAIHDVSPSVALVLYSGRPGAATEISGEPAQWVRAYFQKPFAVEQVTGVLNAIGAP